MPENGKTATAIDDWAASERSTKSSWAAEGRASDRMVRIPGHSRCDGRLLGRILQNIANHDLSSGPNIGTGGKASTAWTVRRANLSRWGCPNAP